MESKKTEIANIATEKHPKNALEKLAQRLDLSPNALTETLKSSAFSLCKDNAQFVAAVVIANTYGLNPILREMYAFPSKSGAVIPIISFDGWVKLVNRQEDFNGVEIIENKEEEENKSGTKVESVTVKFYMKHREHPVVVTEYMVECFDGTKEPWKRWPRRMLRHKAYIQGARLAFGFGGIYDEDEASRIQEAEVITEPLVTLKHGQGRGKEAPPQANDAPAQRVEAPAPSGEGMPPIEQELASQSAWHDIGDLSRFTAKDQNSVKLMAKSLETVALKIGKEEFLRILGVCGFESLQQICVAKDLVALTNLAFTELQAKEEANA